MQQRTPHSRGRKRAAFGSRSLFGAVGFLLGIAFWHSIGFWRFIERTLDRPIGGRVAEHAPKQAGRVAGDLTTLAAIGPPACITLVLDRATGRTTSAPCEAMQMPLRTGRPTSRADASLMPIRRTNAREAWSTSVEAESD